MDREFLARKGEGGIMSMVYAKTSIIVGGCLMSALFFMAALDIAKAII